ncbi:peptidase M6 [Jiangella mangrovi]|uniref:M6 family metalloprotease-like protein n=1 Tax=Jiangella mangrovi TaxID=1524084 RepID=A0A7W9LMG1_9ACTN|nr:peptidase M6 [Jiangella mangrovi]MBB5789164.1 M6 family metalloprotease-like protein [Jiangella mangrovi]
MSRRLVALITLLTALLIAPTPAQADTVAPDHDHAQACALPGVPGEPGGTDRKNWWGDGGHETRWERYVPPVGQVRAIMLFVDFPDAVASANAAPYDDTGYYYDYLRPGAEWLERSSYGRLDFEVTPTRQWVRMPQASTTYGFARTMTLSTQTEYVRDAVEAADHLVDYSQYDVVLVVPPRNASAISFSPGYVSGPGDEIIADGTWVRHGVTFGQDMRSWGSKLLSHEAGHIFGLADLYVEPGDQHRAVRGWDLMGNIGGHAPDFFAWHKWKMGWLDDDQIDCVTGPGVSQHRLTAVERFPYGTKAVVIRTSETTAYVVESRRRFEHDVQACSTGALVYSVDSQKRSAQAPIWVVDASPGAGGSTRQCTDLDHATLSLDGVTSLTLPEGITVEIVRQSGLSDTVTVTWPGD